ncbi:MAG: hypothetical protein IIC64_19640 [SAR324 cluster bacterium]|nr:hypothetical protein [SAR324 cluster bacterium]
MLLLIDNTLTLIVGIVAGLIIAGVLLWWLLRKKPAAAKAFEEAVQSAATGPEEEERQMMNGLVALNLEVREAGLGEDLNQPFENIIDRLRDLVPETAGRFPGEELTWEIKRIATHHLPDLLKRYLALSGNNRQGELEKFRETLASLSAELEEIEELISSDQVMDFGIRAATIRRKFG